MEKHPAIKLDITAVVRDLGTAGVRYVLTGSVAAAAYGVHVEPRDFDLAPDLERENLARLAEVLRGWGAKPMPDPTSPEGLTPEACERWMPDPPTSDHLDHLLTTPHGLVDVVPTRSRAYADLLRLALPTEFNEWTVLVAHPADLIATLRMQKAKHQTRRPHLVAIRARLERGETIAPRLPSGSSR